MAVVIAKSGPITNRDAVPRVMSNGRLMGAPKQHVRGVVAVAVSDAASKYLVGTVPSNAVPVSVKVSAPDIGTTTAADVGLYRTTDDGGAVVDADFFATALVLNAGAISKSEVIFQSGVVTLANSEKPLWELLGLAKDPQTFYDVVLTLTGAADAAGEVLVEVEYTQ